MTTVLLFIKQRLLPILVSRPYPDMPDIRMHCPHW